ncbi:DUF916 domain-containing protein [Agromyces atrinae]|uniref:DUF916 domain-containing protein n=1 Tax=Agromyces atrinae TaxID=592376 RepID=UPI001F55DFE6|nr:DUF916 domain-containing protein [Agromyces atrinae]MCI2956332.1 DUF916 domain-containing protein [Agromyces atrinae]
MLTFPTASRAATRLAGLLVLAATLGLIVAVAPAISSTAEEDSDTIGIAGEPLSDENTTGRTRFSYQLSPGQVIEDGYIVTNTGSVPQTFALFATDAFNSEDGGYGLLDTGVVPTGAGAWVVFEGGVTTVSLDLQPGESRTVPFTLSAPADAAPGDHAAGLVISAVSADGQVLLDRRVGTRLYVRVPGDLQPNLTISSMTSSYTPSFNPFDGISTVTFTVRNAGNVALGAATTVDVRGLFGIGLGESVRQELAEMLPGSTRTVSVDVHGVGQWIYLAPTVRLAPTVDAEALNPGPLAPVDRDIVTFVVPWALLALLVLAGLVFAWVRFSRRRNDKNARAWVEYTEAEARRKIEAERELVAAGATTGSATTPESER